ncbi:MAG: sugar kinase [Treponema sp.]|jgi:2-dehydro-3-deoxygluconokinase|nr:sugar kinase [Treponema sp.]
MGKVVGFGEIMARLTAKDCRRFRQALPGDLELSFGGAEANVAVSISLLGGSSAFVSALPAHSIADACLGTLRSLGVDVSSVVRSGQGRLGIYFTETGANQRPGNVIYDRDNSSVSLEPGSSYDWRRIFTGASWFHITGITPALSKNTADISLDAVKAAKEAGIAVSCDLNFRKKLWNWESGTGARILAGRVMRLLLPYTDLLIANEEDVQDVLGISAGAHDADSGNIDVKQYPEIARQVAEEFPSIKKIAFTLRESVSATHNNWGGMLYDTASRRVSFAPLRRGEYSPYQIRAIVDRVGGGDSFSAALIYALNGEEFHDDGEALAFAAAASCLCHSIYGDFNYTNREEVLALMKGKTSGRIVR